MKIDLYVFIVVLVITIIITIFYIIVKVERPTDLQEFNKLEPFPTIQMKNLPDPQFTITTSDIQDCKTQIVPCDSIDDCSKHCGADYECDTVGKDDNIFYNDIKVGEGNWCLPKNRLKGCGKYTGRTVWSAGKQGQEWKCECLYPSLFGGTYCTENLACKDTSPDALHIDQGNNALVNKDGKVYDPNLPNFSPPDGINNPYAVDKDGKPVYSCRCGYGSNNKKFAKLPNDPYKCHLDPCTADHSSPLWNETNQTCICGLGSVKNQQGKCINESCPYGVYNPLTQECECVGRMARMLCNSRNVPRGKNFPNCDDPENPLGMQCIDRCIYKYCQSKDYSKCGVDWNTGKNRGYRPEFCEDKNCIVCAAGNCKMDDNNTICCECPVGTTYDPPTDSTANKTPGVCIQAGNEPGQGCYHFSDRKLIDSDIVDPIKYRFFWVYQDDDAKDENSNNTYKAWNIDYRDDTEGGKFGIKKKEDAISKCNIRCVSREVAKTGKELQDLLNKMTSCKGITDKKECKALRKRRDEFLANYCDSDVNGYVKKMINDQALYRDEQPKEVYDRLKKSGSGTLDYVCGYACAGDLTESAKRKNLICANKY